METLKNYIEENKERFLEELFDLIRIPSVSSKTENKNDMFRATEYITDQLLKTGADKAEVYKTDGHPVIYGEKMIGKDKPTVLVYGHYDVQPAEPLLSPKYVMGKSMPGVLMMIKVSYSCI